MPFLSIGLRSEPIKMYAFGTHARTSGDPGAWLGETPPAGQPARSTLLAPPGLDSLLGNGEALLAVPRPGQRTYCQAHYTSRAAAIELRAVELTVGLTRLVVENRGYVLQAASWAILGDGLSAIGCELSARAPAAPTIDVLSSWEIALRAVLTLLGPLRSAALAWKIYGAGSVIYETQQGEAHAFAVLSGWLPGLCRFRPASTEQKVDGAIQIPGSGPRDGGSNLPLEEGSRGSENGSDVSPGSGAHVPSARLLAETSPSGRSCLEIYRASELYALVAACLADLGWLPDAPIQAPSFPGADAYPCSTSVLGTFVRRMSAGVTGHHRWLCVEPLEAGSLTQDDVEKCVRSLALRRGIRDPTVLALRAPASGDAFKIALNIVGLGTSPLALAIVDLEDKVVMDEFRQYVFPYAAVILAVGPGLRPRLDPRCPAEQRGGLPSNFVGWQPYRVEYIFGPLGPGTVGAGAVIIAPAAAALRLVGPRWPHIYEASRTAAGVVVPDDLGPEILDSTQIDAKECISHLTVVIVYGGARWPPILRILMHFMKVPFVLRFCSGTLSQAPGGRST